VDVKRRRACQLSLRQRQQSIYDHVFRCNDGVPAFASAARASSVTAPCGSHGHTAKAIQVGSSRVVFEGGIYTKSPLASNALARHHRHPQTTRHGPKVLRCRSSAPAAPSRTRRMKAGYFSVYAAERHFRLASKQDERSLQASAARLSLLKLVSSPEYRRCGRSFRTAMPNAFRCPISTSSRFPRVTPV
jgi:hypothetical protein